jgi:hypothetical protein
VIAATLPPTPFICSASPKSVPLYFQSLPNTPRFSVHCNPFVINQFQMPFLQLLYFQSITNAPGVCTPLYALSKNGTGSLIRFPLPFREFTPALSFPLFHFDFAKFFHHAYWNRSQVTEICGNLNRNSHFALACSSAFGHTQFGFRSVKADSEPIEHSLHGLVLLWVLWKSLYWLTSLNKSDSCKISWEWPGVCHAE